MPKVDFYVLSEKHSPDVFICQLTQKIWQQGHQVHIHTNHQEQANQLDTRMWTFSDISFLPHQLWTESESIDAPVSIGWQQNFSGKLEVLVNLHQVVPPISKDFARIVEVVSLDKLSKETGRNHFREYRELGYELESHNL